MCCGEIVSLREKSAGVKPPQVMSQATAGAVPFGTTFRIIHCTKVDDDDKCSFLCK